VRGGKTGGVTDHYRKARPRFRPRKAQITLDLAFTPANVKRAQRMLAEIHQKIRFGIFNPAEHFPNWSGLSTLAAAGAIPDATLRDYAALWQKGQRLPYSTV